MEYKTILFETKENIGFIKLNRPEALNALNSLFFRETDLVLDSIEKNHEIKALIITGEGKAFAAGADITEMANMTPEMGSNFSSTGQALFDRIEQFPIPVIAAVNGFALGGGCELAMACDIRYSSEKAKFGQPEANLGMIPGYAGTQRLPRLVGIGNALNLLFSASVIDAEEALRIGLVQKIVQHDWLIDESFALAKLIASKGPAAIRKIKQVTRKGMNLSFADACRLETREFGSLFKNEGEEGMKAFLEKRQPNWN
jgi:enoyl-CoA hydratase